jgi:pimeloyl-ACP methyl ester carboxylesterase
VVEMQERAFELQGESEAEEGSGLALWWPWVSSTSRTSTSRRAPGERIQGAESAVIEAAGHLPSLERPEATAPLVRAFLER